ncbi:MAG: hypothetical protein EBQ71_16115 [Betaproteobacteria bacterium]|nr:hypothetical protein [Betaproteobacteria bacterium]
MGATVSPPGRPKAKRTPSGGSAAHAVASVGATSSSMGVITRVWQGPRPDRCSWLGSWPAGAAWPRLAAQVC